MQQPNFEPIAALAGAGQAAYSPQRRPASCGFGLWEVHPNRVPVTVDGCSRLEWNGEFLAVGELDGQPYQLACIGVNESMTARELAERVCALRNGNKPTRVVDFCGTESVSRHTASSVQAELSAKQGAVADVHV